MRTLVGFVPPVAGEVRIDGRLPPGALREAPTAYFAGEATLPGFVRASAWGNLGTGEVVMTETRRIRSLSRSTRQRLGLRTALGRHPLRLIVLDDPWDGLDPDATRWLSSTLETKRDRGAAVVLSSPRLSDLAGICDKYLFLTGTTPSWCARTRSRAPAPSPPSSCWKPSTAAAISPRRRLRLTDGLRALARRRATPGLTPRLPAPRLATSAAQ